MESSCSLGILSANDTLPSLDTNPEDVDVETANVVEKRVAVTQSVLNSVHVPGLTRYCGSP